MRTSEFLERHRAGVVATAALVPLVACALVVPFRDDVANTNAALGLVLLVVAAAATGIRPAGLSAAVSSAVWFDFFLTQPYGRFTIDDQADIETAVLLVLVGLAVTEIALWGRRRQAEASRQEGYLRGVVRTAGLVGAGGSSAEALIELVADQLVEVLGIDDCRFDSASVQGLPRLARDGTIVDNSRTVDVDRQGLPVDSEIELPVQHAGTTYGRFLLTAATRVARPSHDQRLVAVTLADQVGAALATSTELS
jgi:Domain of unknown function (DUF4118)